MRNVFLVGYMGVGKTTIGKLLSVEMNMQFIDLDKYIESRYRKTIQELFDKKGEDAFRKIEREMLHEVATFQNVLISTGGGTPCFYNNMEYMNKMGVTVYVKASVEQLVSRLLASKNARPLIQNKSPQELSEFVTQHLGQRQEFYSQANVTYENEFLVSLAHVSKSVDAIKQLLEVNTKN